MDQPYTHHLAVLYCTLALGLTASPITASTTDRMLDDRDDMPMELISFTATEVGGHVQLDWSTATESNNAGFVVERSSNGAPFVTIDLVAAVGNSQQTTYYQSLDRLPPSGTKHYRIRQNDADGGFSYSPVVTIAGVNDPVVAPNPCTTDLFTISGATAGDQVEIRTAAGQPVRNMTLTSNVVNHQGLPPGVYILRIVDPRSGAVRTAQIVRE